MRFEWDAAKNQRNLVKHNVRFETAALVFDDPYALTQRDESTREEDAGSLWGQSGRSALCRAYML